MDPALAIPTNEDVCDAICKSFAAMVDSTAQEMDTILIRYMIRRGLCPWCIMRMTLWDDISICGYSFASLRDGFSKAFDAVFPLVTEPANCPACLGILPYCSTENFKSGIAKTIANSGFEFPNYILNIRTPLCLLTRDALFVHELYGCSSCQSQALSVNAEDSILSELLPISVKQLLKYILGPYCTPRLGVPVAVSAHLRCILYVETSITSPKIPSSEYEQMSSSRRKEHAALLKRGRNADEVLQGFIFDMVTKGVSRHALIEELANTTIPLQYQQANIVVKTVLESEPIYITGRYLKKQRYISQTGYEDKALRENGCAVNVPDANMNKDEDEVHGFHPKASVSSLLLPFFIKHGNADNAIFHAAGREDIDVRMLGSGRPFIIELLNSRNGLSRDWVSLAQRINSDPHVSQFVQIYGDELVAFEKSGRDLIARLASGSNDKCKAYRAICWCERPLPQNASEICDAVKDLLIEQATPIRVLHRRTAMIRKKMIYKLQLITIVSPHCFVLELFTQAGTYIKEFCNSDFGRTCPSLSSLLFGECQSGSRQPEIEILQLDVLSIDMEWPPLDVAGRRTIKQ